MTYTFPSKGGNASYLPLWKQGEPTIPVAVELPKEGGFINADRRTMQLFEALKVTVREATSVRLVDSRFDAIVWMDVNSLGAASTERNASLLGHVTVHAKTVQPGCVMSSFTWFDNTARLSEDVIYMVTQTHQKEIRQLCASPAGCAVQIADDVAFWIEQNFKLPTRRK